MNAIGFAHELATYGHGLARLPQTLARPQLDNGELVHVLEEVWVEEPVSFVFPGTPGPILRAFLDGAVAFFTTK